MPIAIHKSVNHKWRKRITEQANPASASLDTKSTREILRIINREDHRVAPAVRKTLPQIARAVDLAVEAIRKGGRLVYLGAGSSGRMGMLDAVECVPTFGTDRVVAILAGAPASLRRPVEGVEDNEQQSVWDLGRISFSARDVLVGISASGRAPYVLGAMRFARRHRAKVVALTCNPQAPMAAFADVTICALVGPEVLAGSSRMKAGTAQKLVLNMLSTATMVRLGRVLSSDMINVQPTNEKLSNRAEGILMKLTGASQATAAKALKDAGRSLPVALLMILKKVKRSEAARQLKQGPSVAALLRKSLEK
ncbi:MAG: N-acetylmuramic acid 6-phosphate etherase [Terriglobia bacterium]